MKKLLKIFIVSIFLFNCSTKEPIDRAGYKNVLENVLTLKLSFGSDEEKIKDEFLLANPVGIAVTQSGDIIVSDEYRIKVFDGNGKEKTIFGRQGQGPGEFSEYSPYPHISNTGYLTITEDISRFGFSVGFTGYNLFSPEFKFIDKKNIRNDPIFNQFANEKNINKPALLKIIFLNEREKVYSAKSGYRSGKNEDRELRNEYLIYQNSDTLVALAEYSTHPELYDENLGGMYMLKPFVGRFFWAELPNRRVVFTHTEQDVSTENGNYKYKLYVTSLDNFETEAITQTYFPVVIPDSLKNNQLRWSNNREMQSRARNLNRRIREIDENTIYYLPMYDMKTDGNYIFAFTYKTNDLGQSLAEVLDASTKERISTAYFPFIPEAIKNRYAYRISRDSEGFAIVEKYKIDPAVYGK